MNIFLYILAGLILLLLLYFIVAYIAYYRVKPVERSCKDCDSPAHVNGYDLFLRETGVDNGKTPVILVHGGPGHSSESFKTGFDFLGDSRRVFYYDQRGSGYSQQKKNPNDYSIDHLIEDLESLRRDIIKSEKVVLIGHSFGSALVQRYAIKYEQHVEKMIIIGGIRINNSISNHTLWKLLGPALYTISMGLPPGDSIAADTWFNKSANSDNHERMFDAGKKELVADLGPISFVPWFRISLSITGHNYQDELAKLATPTLFIFGSADSPYTGKPVADELCALLPDCRSYEFNNSGHWPYLEEPQHFQKVVNDFLGNQ